MESPLFSSGFIRWKWVNGTTCLQTKKRGVEWAPVYKLCQVRHCAGAWHVMKK